MEFRPTAIPDVVLIEPQIYKDSRGFFMETFQAERFAERGIDLAFVQDNHSGSQQGVLRGLHYQIRQSQGKLVRVIAGEVFDVAVDLRHGSHSFGRWGGSRLPSDNRRQMWIPAGFAHGFYVLSSWAEVTYKTTDLYAPEWERTLVWNDPQVGIDWPLLGPPELSEKDRQGLPLAEAELYTSATA